MTRSARIIARRLGLPAIAAAALLSLVPSAKADVSSTAFKNIFVRTDATVRAIGESNLFAPVPNMSVGVFTVPEGDTQLFTVLYSAQAELRDASTSIDTFNSDDVLELQLLAVKSTGATIILSPLGPAAFASENSPQAHALSWSGRLSAGFSTFKLLARVRDVAPAGTVSGILSNAMLTITRYD
jgi:hypothetical protein